MKIENVADNVFSITENFGSNDSMVVTEEGVVLIDAPYKPSDALAWKREIDARGKILYLITTDHHFDHVMTNFLLGGTVIAHEETRRQLVEQHPDLDYLRSRIAIIAPADLPLLDDYYPLVPTITFPEQMTLHVGGLTFHIMRKIGHTPNTSMVYVPEKRILFSGDNVCEGCLPGLRESQIFTWFETLKYIMSLDIDVIVPGHGRVVGKEGVKNFYDMLQGLVDQVQNEMEKGVPKDVIVETVRYEDRIHTADKVPPLQRVSVANVYDQLMAKKGFC